MNLFAVLAELAIVLCLLTLVYIYAGFPMILWVAARRHKPIAPRPLSDHELPSISFLVSAHNEALVIETKLENCLTLDYPPEKLTFVFVSDSTDSTNEIMQRYASDRIHVHILRQRVGKVRAICSVIPSSTGEIFVFSDANTYYRPDALRKLVRHFQDPQIGVVTGDVRLMPSGEKFGAGEGLYYRYERWLQVVESRFWATVAVDGAMYALRRGDFDAPSTNGVNDDLATGMNVGIRGLRIIYDPEAIADEPPTPSDELEFKRKVRIVALGIQALLFREGIPPLRQWRLLWIFLSHKVLRWMAPVFLIVALLASMVTAWLGGPFWMLVLGIQILFYCLAVAGWLLPAAGGFVFRIPYYFTMVNLAAFLGIIRGLRKGQGAIWARPDRLADTPQVKP